MKLFKVVRMSESVRVKHVQLPIILRSTLSK